jgi:replicative DNA helicase
MPDFYYKEYPQDIDAEVWLLGGILQDPRALGEVSIILKHATAFSLEKHQAVWKAMVELSKKGDPIEPLSIANVLEKTGELSQVGGKDYIFRLMEEIPSAANIEYYAGIIKDKYILRSLILSSNQTIKDSLDPTAITENVLQATSQRVFDLITDNDKENVQPFGSVADAFLKKLLMRRHNELSGCPTGFSFLDNLTNGLQKTDLIILGARPSVGKTALGLNIATNAALLGKTVLFFSLEMSAEQIISRVLSSIAGIDLINLRNNRMDAETSKCLMMHAREMKDLPFFIDDTSNLRAFDAISRSRVFKKRYGKLDLVIVDYLQLMDMPAKYENRAIGVGENSRMLKSLAKQLEVPVLALAQVSRGVESRPASDGIPKLSDLRDSGSIEQDADMVMFLHRVKPKNQKEEEYELSEEEKLERRKADLVIAKHRNGPIAKIKLEFQEEITTFKERLVTRDVHPNDRGTFNNF